MTDTLTMLRRTTRHTLRNPSAVIMTVAMPVIVLLLFVGVFGGTLHAGLSAAASHGDAYVDYAVAGVLIMAVGYGASTTAMAVNQDMTSGIIARFRTMAISRTAVLTGHVVVSVVRTVLSAVLVVTIALAVGFRPTSNPLHWAAVIGLMALLALALSWLAVAVGLLAKSAEGTSPFIMIVQLFPFLSSAFVAPGSMSSAVRWISAHEPFTPIIDTLRGLLLDTPVHDNGVIALAWCVGLALAGYLWSMTLFKRDPKR
jgi:ABC-2 type transport system permease protein